jgi:hypothetical protein
MMIRYFRPWINYCSGLYASYVISNQRAFGMSSATCNHTPRLNAILCRWHCCSLSPAVLSSIHHCLFVPIPVFVLRDMPTVITIRGMRPNRCKAAWYESVRHVISPPGMKHKARYSSWKAKTPPIPVLLMFPASGDTQGTSPIG